MYECAALTDLISFRCLSIHTAESTIGEMLLHLLRRCVRGIVNQAAVLHLQVEHRVMAHRMQGSVYHQRYGYASEWMT